MLNAIREFFKPPVFKDDEDKTFSARIVFSFILFSYFIFVLGIILVIVLTTASATPQLTERGIIILATGFVATTVSLFLLKSGLFTAAGAINVAIFGIDIYALTYAAGGLQRPVLFANVLVLIIGALTFRNRGIIFTGIFLMIGVVVLYAAQTFFPLPTTIAPVPILNTAVVNGFILMGAAIMLQFIVNILNETVSRVRKNEGELIDKNDELQTFSEGLEKLVNDRTAELQMTSLQLERRAAQFRTIADISRSIAALQDVNSLLATITEQISTQFNVYHVGIFLIDENKEFAVLRATNSEGGQRMLARGHRLRLGTQGIVGYVAQRGKPRIALDTGIDATYFNNPDLPRTRSEAAIPLIIGGEIIGALDVQSEQPSAFNENDIEILSILASQAAIAIQNARLFSQTSQTLKEVQETSGERIRSDWERFASRAERIGYQLTGTNVEPLEKPVAFDELREAVQKGEVESSPEAMVIPIKLRGETIGMVGLKAHSKTRQWTEREIATVQAAADRVALAVENARLIEESQKRASLERMTSDISGKISSSLRFETILRTTAEEISRALSGSEVIVQIQPSTLEGSDAEKRE